MAEKIILGKNGNWGVKENGLLGYNDEDNVFKAIEFDFSRSSTATRESSAGLITDSPIDTPRIDFSDGGALLLEPESRNEITYSEDFTDASWTTQELSVTANQSIAPDGTLTADKLIPTTNSSSHQILTANIVSSQTCTASVFAKSAGYDSIAILDRASAVDGAAFNLTTQTVTNSGSGVGKIEDFGNGWYRCSVTITTTGARFYVPTSSSVFAGDGTSGVYIWGAQLETLSYPTSYIPTSGATATRLGEVSEKVIPSELSLSTRGTVFLDYTLNINLIAGHFPFSIIDYNNGSPNEWSSRGSFRFIINTNGSVSYDFVLSGLVTSPTIVSNIFPNIGSRGKMAVSWDGTNVTFSVNGVNYQDTLSANFTGSLDGVYLGQLGTFNNTHIGGKFNEVRLYNTELTDQELQNLTTL